MRRFSAKEAEAIRASTLFDPEWYLETYPDVKALGMDPLEHFLWIGARLKRNPSPRFNTVDYLAANADSLPTGVNPLLHFVNSERERQDPAGQFRADCRKPTINWVMNADNAGWAYGNNAKLLGAWLPDFTHVFDGQDGISDIALYFDVKIFKMRGVLGRRNVLRVGGPRPIELAYGNDRDGLARDVKSFDAVIVLNRHLYEMFSPLHANVHLIPNALDLQAWTPERRRVAPGRREFVVGFAGNLTTSKERMIKGFDLAEQACGHMGVELLHFAKGESQVARHDMRERFYGRIDCLLHPVAPGKEGCSNVIMEALSMGVPVITTRDAGYHAENIADGDGVLYCERDVASIVAAVERLRKDDSLRQQLADGARRFVLQHHDVNRTALRYQQVLAPLARPAAAPKVSFVPFWEPVADFASSRLRCDQPVRLLSTSLSASAHIGLSADADVVLVSQLASDDTYAALVANPRTFVIYDVCDRYFADDRQVGGVHAKGRFFQMAARADVIVASTVALKREIDGLGLGKPVVHIPDGIDYQDRRDATPTRGGGPVAWFGNPGRGNFESSRWMIDHVLRDTALGMKIITRRRSLADLAGAGDHGKYLDVCVDWRFDSFVEELRACSLCIVSHSAEETSKSPNRLVTAVANGVPAIVSNAPSCASILRAAGMGFAIVRDEASLGEAIRRLSDPEERTRYLDAVGAIVEARYGDKALRARYEQLLADHVYTRKVPQTRPLRVMFVSHNLTAGEGAPTSLMQTVVGLRDAYGLEPIIYGLSPGSMAQEYEKRAIEVIVPDFGMRSRLASSVLSRVYPKAEAMFRDLLVRERIDVVVANTAVSLCCAEIAEALGIPALSIIRESSPEHVDLTFATGAYREACRRALGHDRNIVFVSGHTRNRWHKVHGLERAVVIPNGISPLDFDAARRMTAGQVRRDLGLPGDGLLLLSVGTVIERKAQLDIVEAFAALPPELVGKARLALVGARPSVYVDLVKARIAALPPATASRIHLLPETDQVALWYRAADAFVFASRNESYPRVIVEAMCAGLPIVSSAVFGTREQIVDGESGLLYPPGDVAALTRHLMHVISDDSFRTAMADASGSRFWELTTFQEMLHRYYALIRNVAGERVRSEPTGQPHQVAADDAQRDRLPASAPTKRSAGTADPAHQYPAYSQSTVEEDVGPMTDDTAVAPYTASLTAGSGFAFSIADLERRAEALPSMGGPDIGSFLRELARLAPADMSIVEIGCWLGAMTAQLAIGVQQRVDGYQPPIHCFDRWRASEAEVEKARISGISLLPGQDTLPLVLETLRPFDVNISFTKGNIRQAVWNGGPISIHIDDAAKTPAPFKHMLQAFGPSWVPGVTVVVLMDYNYWKMTGIKKHEFQKRFIEGHSGHFRYLQDFGNSGVALRYEKMIDFSALEARRLPTWQTLRASSRPAGHALPKRSLSR